MTCEDMRPLVSALADGELSGDEEKTVREHLASCEGCRSLERELRATSALVAKHALRPEVDELSWARFEEALAAESSPRKILSPWRRDVLGLVGAAALVAVTAGLSLLLTITSTDTIGVTWTPRHLPSLAYSDPIVNAAKVPTVPENLEGVANAGAASVLNAAQRKALERDGLVQLPGTERSLAAFYEQEHALVTADAALLVWGGAVSRATLEVECENVAPALVATLVHLERELRRFEERSTSESFTRGARLARRIVAVALGHTVDRDPESTQDVVKLRLQQGRSLSAVLGREVDWTRFHTRGRLSERPSYFKSVTWLSEAALHLDAAHPDELRAATLIALALARSPEALGRFVDLEDAVSLIHGPQDDLGALEVLEILRNALGPSVRPDLLGNDEALAVLEKQARLKAAASRTGEVATIDSSDAPRFRLMGAARSLEDLVLSSLSGERLKGRARPTSLDLLAAIGSEPARAVASSEGTPGYATALDALSKRLEDVTQVPRAVARTGSGVERSRLFALAKLVERRRSATGAGPAFMETQAYSDRALLAALASLNTALPGSEEGTLTTDPSAPLPLVEPLPGLYARLAHGARRLALGLAATTPNARRATERLHRVSDLLSGLSLAATETLEGRGYTAESRLALQSFASAARIFAPKSAFTAEDVHVLVGADGKREWLERTSGPLDRLYVVLADEKGALRLVSGPALSARELVAPAPLTQDDAARAARSDPSWASHIVR